MTIKNIEELRNYVLKTIEDVEKGKKDVNEAAVIIKGMETIGSSIKLQLSYAAMRGEIAEIDFLQDCHQVKQEYLE